LLDVVSNVVGLELIWETSTFAGSVSESLLTKEEFQELKNHLGKSSLNEV